MLSNMSDRLERIEKYLLDEMSGEEKQRFEMDLVEDPSLKEMMSRMQIINRALDVAAEDDLRSFLHQLENKQSNSRSNPSAPKIRNLITRIAAAASILLIVSVGLWYFMGQGSSGLDRYRDTHYLAYDYTQIRGEYRQRNDFPSGLTNGQYDKAETIQWFITWLQAHPDDYEARYILADVYRKNKEVNKAKAELAIIISSQSILWTEKAEWNYVLLSKGETSDELAATTLQKMISKPAHSYHRQAIELDRMQHK